MKKHTRQLYTKKASVPAEEVQRGAVRLQQTERQLQEALREAEDSQAAAAKYEADLEALSSAYTSLEAHAHNLESQDGNETGKKPVQSPGDN